MTYRLIYAILPVPIFYTDWLIADNAHGLSLAFFILIRPSHRDDHALLEHELQHCRQFWRTLWVHAVIYFTSRRYRFYAEADAFAVQIESGGSYRNAVVRLVNNYRLGITEQEAEDALNRRLS